MLGARGAVGRARPVWPWIPTRLGVVRCSATAVPSKPLRQLERLQALIHEVSETNRFVEKQGRLARYADLAPVLER